jgi:hypothetical protein
MRSPSMKAQTIHENPSAMIELMEDLNKSGFEAAFSFTEGLLEIFVRSKFQSEVLP